MQYCSTVFLLSLRRSVLAPVPLRSVLVKTQLCFDWSANTCLNPHCSPCVQTTLFCFQLPVSFTSIVNICINYANVRAGDIQGVFFKHTKGQEQKVS